MSFGPFTLLFMPDSARSELVHVEIQLVASILSWHMQHPNSIALRSNLQKYHDSVVCIVLLMRLSWESCSCCSMCAWVIAILLVPGRRCQ